MYKRKSIFITFEGIEGSGKSYLSKKLYQYIKKKKIPVLLTREPGGSPGSEFIRKLILTGAKNKFSKITDTLLYLAARNEHFEKTIKPAILKKKIIICDRFTDSTLAYQVFGSNINKNLVNNIHKNILGKIKPNITFVLTVNTKKAKERLKMRKKINRYDKFSFVFYKKVQNAFLNIAKKNKKRYLVLDNSKDEKKIQKIIINKFNNEFYK